MPPARGRPCARAHMRAHQRTTTQSPAELRKEIKQLEEERQQLQERIEALKKKTQGMVRRTRHAGGADVGH